MMPAAVRPALTMEDVKIGDFVVVDDTALADYEALEGGRLYQVRGQNHDDGMVTIAVGHDLITLPVAQVLFVLRERGRTDDPYPFKLETVPF